jgi:hypothetical protein
MLAAGRLRRPQGQAAVVLLQLQVMIAMATSRSMFYQRNPATSIARGGQVRA